MNSQLDQTARATWRTWSLATRELALAAGMAVAFAIVAPLALYWAGPRAVGAAAIAASVCFASAAGALAVSHTLNDPSLALARVILSMMIRTGTPLFVITAIYLYGGLRTEVSLVYYFLFYYLLALAIETPLSLPKADRCVTACPPPQESR